MKVTFNPRISIPLALLATGLALLAWYLWPRPPLSEKLPGNDRFGLCFVSSADALAGEERYAGAVAVGARWDRWPLYWHWVDAGGYVGTHPGGRHDYDTLVAQEIAHGLTPLVILMGTPAGQAAAAVAPTPARQVAGEVYLPPPKENSLPEGQATLPPASLFEPIFAGGGDQAGPGRAINPANTWAMFVFNTVERYRPGGKLARQHGWPAGTGVRHWEIWNEPDYRLFWRGSVADYRRLLEVAYKSIKAADPAATVLLGGLAFYDNLDWFPDLLKQTGNDPGRAYFDVFSFHHYRSIYNGERMLSQARAALDAYNLAATPIWITESGVSVWDDYPATAYDVSPDEPFRASMAEQAAYIIQNSALAFSLGAERYFHFMLHDDCGDGPSSAYGLRQNFSPHACNPAEGRPRPAYAAYELAAEQFREVVPLWREKAYEQDRVAFYRPADQTRLVALWATRDLTVTTTLSATGETARLYWLEAGAVVSDVTGLRRTQVLTPSGGVYVLTLPPAAARTVTGAGDTGYPIGGQPYLLVERDTQPPQAGVLALPPDSPPDFRVEWHGDDRGSGMAGYEVWVSVDGGPLRAWLTDTLATEAAYTGQVGSTYGFAVRGRDRAGNQAPLPSVAEAVTRIVTGLPVHGVVLGPAGQPVAGATVTIQGANTGATLVTGDGGAWPAAALPAGEYALTASAPGYETWPSPRRLALTGPASITLTLASAPNAVSSGDFEGSQVWNGWEWPDGQISLSIDAFDGQAGVRLGEGTGQAAPCPTGGGPGQLWTLRQHVAVPAGGQPVLSFMLKISTTQAVSQTAWVDVTVLGNLPHPLTRPGELSQATDWALVSRDLSAWQGQEVDIQFQVWRCSDRPFAVTLDRVNVGSSGAGR